MAGRPEGGDKLISEILSRSDRRHGAEMHVAGGDRPWMAYRSSPAAPDADGHGLPFPRTEMRVARG